MAVIGTYGAEASDVPRAKSAGAANSRRRGGRRAVRACNYCSRAEKFATKTLAIKLTTAARRSRRGNVARAQVPARSAPPAHEQHVDRVLRQLRVVYGSVRRHSREVERACGISASQAWVLREVQRSPGIGLSSLAVRLSIHASTASQLVEKLVREGLLAKARSAADQRRIGLRLTERGDAVVARAPRRVDGVLPRALMRLSNRRLQSLHASLAALLRQMDLSNRRDAGTLECL